MAWVWIILAFFLGAANGLVYGHRARITAWAMGYQSGYLIGWDDGAAGVQACVDVKCPRYPHFHKVGEHEVDL